MKRFISLMAAICLLCTGKVYGATIVNVAVEGNISTGEILISGEITDSLTEGMISVIICDIDVMALSDSAISFLPKIKGIGESATRRGKFNIPIFLAESVDSGEYACFISGENMQSVRVEFDYISPFEAQRKLNTLNAAAYGTEFVSAFVEYAHYIGFDASAIDQQDFNKTDFFIKLFSSRPQGGFSKASDVIDYFNTCYGLQILDQMEFAEDMEEYIFQNADALMIATEEFESFERNIRLLVCERIDSAALLTSDRLQQFLMETGVICSFETATVWNKFQETITKYPDYFSLTTGQKSWYDSISDKNGVFKIMFENRTTFYTMESVKILYVSAIKTQYDKESNRGPSGGTGGSGGNSPGKLAIERTDTSIQTSGTFTDLGSVPWAQEAITYLAQKGIVTGVGEGLFSPERSVTREEFVKMIVGAFHLDSHQGELTFEDIDMQAWYTPYIKAAVHAGAVNGMSKDLFGIGETITRQDMAAMIYRICRNSGVELKQEKIIGFEDFDSVLDYAKEAVTLLAGSGIINGVSEREFAPKEVATRAQAVKIIYNVLSINAE